MTPRDDYFDRLPASGLQEDAFDDQLREKAKALQAEYWGSFQSNDEAFEEDQLNPRRRGRARNYGGDGVTNIRMCQTEVALRLARFLAASPLLTSTVYLQLGGAEVVRTFGDTAFPVARYLSRWGFTKDRGRLDVKPRWIGFYSHKQHSRKLLLNFDKFDGHIMAFFATGQRLIVHCSAGNVTETRSPAEVHDLNRTIGRAVGWHGTKPDDVIAVCTPRSKRFRKLAALRSQSVGVQRAGLRFFHVDRGGSVFGLSDGSAEP